MIYSLLELLVVIVICMIIMSELLIRESKVLSVRVRLWLIIIIDLFVVGIVVVSVVNSIIK